MFDAYSKYFRDALVRANYQNLKANVYKTFEFLDIFFDNLLLGGQNILNRNDLIVSVGEKQADVGVNVGVNLKSVGVNREILNLLIENQNLTVKELAEIIGKSNRTIERAIAKLKKENNLVRIGSDKTGYWKVVNGEWCDV